MVAGLHLLMAR
ncbi:hypothetical protein CGLO_18281 [Colletotrichum gloeosporioides Cg-14]|uniref:Uncharacterized protein n=1 Tax=Colletotrichum gloeosporioides (strain Cg-14) TaxID=1237896 RepID=T0KV03_COLGC|nr:hypothetical protein CGLO_18281 [Colletotrichum gloeosporioides Cg-14]